MDSFFTCIRDGFFDTTINDVYARQWYRAYPWQREMVGFEENIVTVCKSSSNASPPWASTAASIMAFALSVFVCAKFSTYTALAASTPAKARLISAFMT